MRFNELDKNRQDALIAEAVTSICEAFNSRVILEDLVKELWKLKNIEIEAVQ